MILRAIYQWRLPSRILELGKRTLVMGVLNVTPDSFYDGGRHFSKTEAIRRGLQLAEEGADIIDIGGESTRPPHSQVLPACEEQRRILPVIEELRKRLTIPISVDTYKAEVARSALIAGAEIVNDIGGLRFDIEMASVVAASKAALVVMHSRGAPVSMHRVTGAQDLLKSVVSSLRRAVQGAVEAGISMNRIVLDPGLGFSKRTSDNLLLLRRLNRLKPLKLPLLVGASRKSFIGQILNLPVQDRLYGSLAAAAAAVLGGAHILRAHDVKETVQVVKVCDAIMKTPGRTR